MTEQEITKIAHKAKEKYDKLTSLMDEIFTHVPEEARKKHYNNDSSYYKGEFHITIQLLLLGLANIDKRVDENEVTLLRFLADNQISLEDYIDFTVKKEDPKNEFKYDLFYMGNQEKRWEMVEYFNNKFSDLLNRFFLTFALVDLSNENKYYKKFINELSDIAYTMLLIDNKVEDSTTREAEQYIQTHFVECYEKACKTLSEGYSTTTPPRIGNDPASQPKLLREVFEQYHNLTRRNNSVLVNYVNNPATLENALVYIETDTSTGTGFIISEDGVCITCEHVIDNAKNIFARITLENGQKEIHRCRLLYKSKENDFALIKLETINQFYFETEGDFSSLELGHEIAIFGYPFGAGLSDNVMELAPTLTKGYISSKQIKEGCEFYFLDAQARPGNSGGPVFDGVTGKVIGYLCGSYGDQSNRIVFMRSLKFYTDNLIKD